MTIHNHFDEADKDAVLATAKTNQVEMREDAGIHAARQLDYVKGQIYLRKSPTLRGLQLVPQDTDAPEWAETITYRSYDTVGMAKVIANYADDLPRADVKGKEVTVNVRTIGDSFGYNVQELLQSSALGTQLPAKKGFAARRAIELKLNSVALEGDTDFGLYGFLNHPNITQANPTNGNWSDAATTAEEILADIRQMYNGVLTQSKGVHVANRLAIPLTLEATLQEKTFVDSTDTVMDRLRVAYPGLEVLGMPELNGSAGSMQGFIGEFSVENASIAMPMPFKQLAAQARNLELVVPCYARTGGVVVDYPLAFLKAVNL